MATKKAPKFKEKDQGIQTKYPLYFQAPFNWIKELPELEANSKCLLPMESWLIRHCSDQEYENTLRVQPIKLFVRGCTQVFISVQSKLFSEAQNCINWMQEMLDNCSQRLKKRKIDPSGIQYLINATKWFAMTSQGKNLKICQNFSELPKSAQYTVHSSKLLFYCAAHFPLEIQKQFARELVEEKKFCNFEVMHQYVRILRKCRHQERNETLGMADLTPTLEEILFVNEGLALDPTNYKIKTTAYELLYDFVQIKMKTSWKPFKIFEQEFVTPAEIVRFLHIEIRRLLAFNYRSVRLNNLATKLNICRLFREIYQDQESRRFGLHRVDKSTFINPKSSSANFYIGLRDIHFRKYEDAVIRFKQAFESKPLSPKYTLAYIRALVASCINDKSEETKVLKLSGIRTLIQEKIAFGTTFNWSKWNIHHLQFLNGLLTWVINGHDAAYNEWFICYCDSKFFRKQFSYLSSFGLKRLMLSSTLAAFVDVHDMLKYCNSLRISRMTLSLENKFINALENALLQQPAKKSEQDLIIFNKFYMRCLRPVDKMIQIKKTEEIALSSIDWVKFQETKLIVEFDQAKLIQNQCWYRKKIFAENISNSDEKLLTNCQISILHRPKKPQNPGIHKKRKNRNKRHSLLLENDWQWE